MTVEKSSEATIQCIISKLEIIRAYSREEIQFRLSTMYEEQLLALNKSVNVITTGLQLNDTKEKRKTYEERS